MPSPEATPSTDDVRVGRGRPRVVIDHARLLDVVEGILGDEGPEAVTIERAARELGVSRATLYRSVPSKEHLLGLVFRRMTDQLLADARELTADRDLPAIERLHRLIRAQVASAIRARAYLFVFFGREWLEQDIYDHWRSFTHEFEEIWMATVEAAVAEGTISAGDPRTATRLILGMLVWISRWYRPGRDDERELGDEAIRLLGVRR